MTFHINILTPIFAESVFSTLRYDYITIKSQTDFTSIFTQSSIIDLPNEIAVFIRSNTDFVWRISG